MRDAYARPSASNLKEAVSIPARHQFRSRIGQLSSIEELKRMMTSPSYPFNYSLDLAFLWDRTDEALGPYYCPQVLEIRTVRKLKGWK
jgi:hypothetical protein